MCRQQQWWSGLVVAVLLGLVGVTAVAAGAQFLPVLVAREGATRFVQIPVANGLIDYLTLLNERDGGINGVKLIWEECETVYDVDRGIECYERLKRQGPTGAAVVLPRGTPMTYALTERATDLPVGARLLHHGAHRAFLQSRAAPNTALHLTAYSVRSCVAPASGSR